MSVGVWLRLQAEIVEATDTKSAGAGESKASESKSASSGSGSGSGSGGAGAGAGSESKSSVPLVRRVIDHDNSCLFNAISFVLDNRNRQGQETLRPLVAATILSDPTTYTEGYLGGKNAQECACWHHSHRRVLVLFISVSSLALQMLSTFRILKNGVAASSWLSWLRTTKRKSPPSTFKRPIFMFMVRLLWFGSLSCFGVSSRMTLACTVYR